jgi:hypothetical protein
MNDHETNVTILDQRALARSAREARATEQPATDAQVLQAQFDAMTILVADLAMRVQSLEATLEATTEALSMKVEEVMKRALLNERNISQATITNLTRAAVARIMRDESS